MGWIVYSKDGQTERCVLHKLEYSGTVMGDRSVIATFSSEKKIDFNVFDYINYRGERFELELLPTVKKVSSREYKYELRFVSLKYELERCMMRNIVPGDNGIVYPTPLTVEFTGDVKYLAERIQACLDAMYGKGTWSITIAEGTESEEKNISMSNQNCWDALSIINTEYKLNYFVKGRNVTIGGEEPVVDNVFEYGKGKGLYEIERISDTDTGVVTKLRAYGGTRNLDYSYPKLPEWTDSVLPANYALSPLRLMLPSFKTDGKTDYVLASEEAIAKYGIREGVITYDDIYPSITGMKNSAGQAIDEIKSVSAITSDTQPTFTVGLYDLGFDLSDSLTTNEAQLSMKSGSLQGYTFNITKIEKASDGSYTLTLGRNTLEEGDTGNFTVPNKDWNMKAGDKFVLLNILMPQEYIRDAENRLLARAKEYLAKYSTTNYSYNVGVDEIFMARNVNFYNDIMEGKRLTVNDQEIGINNENIIIQSLTIKEGEGLIPTFEVTLNNETTASTLDRIQGQISEVETSVNNNFSSQSELLRQYRKKLDKSVWDSIFVIHKDDSKNPERITSVQSLVGLWTNEFLSSKGLNPGSGGGSGEGGATALYQLNDIAKNASETGVLGAGPGKVLTYGTDGKWYAADAVGLDETALGKYLTDNNYAKKSDIPSLSGYATESWVLGKNYITSDALSGYATQSWVKNQGYATSSALQVVSDKLNDFLTGTDTDGIINKWKELESFLEGQTQTSTLTELLAVKADKATTLSGYGITDAYTKSEINSKLGGYVTTTALNTALAKKVDVAFLGKVFGFIGDNNSEVSINDTEAVITSIKAKFGLWTDEYLSSKGLNPNVGGGSGEGATALYQLNDVAQNANGTGVLGAEVGKVLTYGSDGKWYAAKAGMDEDALSNYLTVNNYAKKSDIPSLDGYATQSWVNTALGNKVDKVSGMGLSQNNFTDALLKKLNGIAEGANKYILPVAKAAVLGGVMIGSTLTVSATGVLNLPEVMTAGTYAKVTTDIYGRVTAGSSLSAGDIPVLGISKITGLQDALDKKVNKSDFATEFDKAMQRWFVRDTANKGLHPADYDSEAVGIYSDSYVSSKGVNTGTGSGTGGASSLGELNNVGSWADEIPTVDRIMVQRKGATHWESLNLSDIGLNESQLADYLTTNNYAKKSDIPSLSGYATQSWVNGLLDGKVDKVEGKGLSANDFTDTLLNKLNGIEAGANKYVLPTASSSVLGGVKVGSTLAIANGVLNLKSGIATAGTYTKVTVDTYGRVTAGTTLAASDIPTLAISKISGLQTALDGKANTDGSNATGTWGISITGSSRRLYQAPLTNEDLNDLTYTNHSGKMYYAGGDNTTVNFPSGAYGLMVWRIAAGYTGQIGFGSNNNLYKRRIDNNGVATGWMRIIDESNFSTILDTRYVTKTFLSRLFGAMDADGNEIAVNNTSTVIDSIKAKVGLWTEQYLSSKGLNPNSGGGGSGSDYDRLDNWSDYDVSKAGYVLSAGLGWDLNTRVESLESKSITLTTTGTGNGLASFTQTGNSVVFTKANFLTSHQTIYGLTLQKNGTSLGTYTPNSAAKTINITVPTKVSELSNDSGFALKSYVDGNFPKLTEGLIPASYLPSYVDDVIESASLSAFPKTGESGKIYVALDTNLTYRWSGTTYVEISPSLALGETSNTAYAGDKGKANATAIAALKTITISAGTGLSGGGNLTANRTISLKAATTATLGGVIVGDRLSVDADGILTATYTYTLPTASSSVLGGVKVGTTLAIASGVLNLKAVGTAGTYFKTTTDAYGRVTAGSNPTTLAGFGITDGVNAVTVSGSGNAVTSASVSGHTLTLSKGTTFLTKATFDDLFEKVNIGTTSAPVYAIKAKYGLYTEQFLSSMGLNTGTGGGGGGSDYDRLDTWTDYDASKAGWVLSAGLGNDLNTRVTSLENGAAVTVTPSGTGTVVTGVTKAGTVITVTKGNLAFGSITGKPTTLAGYGITDAYTKTQTDGKYVTLSTAQTISGLKTFSNVIRLGNNAIQRVHKDEGNNASGTWWYTANYAAIQAGIGCFTSNNASPRLFMGWGETPWNTESNLTVSSTALTYKGNSILHSANYNAYAPTKTGGGASGLWNIDVTGYSKRLYFNQSAAVANTLMTNAGLYYNQVSSSTDTGYPTDYGHVIRLQRGVNTTLTSSQLVLDLFHQTGASGLNQLYLRTGYGDGSKMVWGIFVQLLHTGNYTSLITKLGTATVGGTAKGIYLNAGTPTAMSATIGSATLPVYMNAGTITACSTTLGVSITGTAPRLIPSELTNQDLNSYIYSSYSGRMYYAGGGNTTTNVPTGIGAYGLMVWRIASGYTGHLMFDSGGDFRARFYNGTTWSAWDKLAYITDNVASATKLQTARTINGTSFNGTANITTANWGTARSIGIVNSDGTGTAVTTSVNGSANVNLKLPATIKAALSGNATTATTLQTSRTLWGQSFNGSANVSGTLTGVESVVARSGRINNFLSYMDNSGNPAKGTICITLPNGWISSMNTYEIWVYEYSTATNASVITIGAYNYNGGGDTTKAGWVNIGYHTKGSYSKGVRLAYNGSKCVILLGNTTTTWLYPKVYLKTICTGHSNQTLWGGTSTISLITSESGYTNIATPARMDEFFGDTSVTGALNVSGAATFASTVTATGTIASTAGYLKSTLNGNTVQIGSQNSSWAHFQSSVPFYFNTRINVNGHLYPHTNNAFTSGGTSNRWSNVFATAGNFSSYIDIGSIRISYDSANNALKVAKTDGTATGLYAMGFLSSMGLATGTGGGGGGSDYDRLDSWSDYTADKAGYVLSAGLGNDLNTRLTSVTANYVTTNTAQTITVQKTWTVSQRMSNTSIQRVNNASGANATGSHWYKAGYAELQFGIGVYTDANANPRAYIGWTATPWAVSANLTVSSTQLTYKANNILHAANYNDYAPSKTGTGASGTWGISISGNAATAAKLLNTRQIFGKAFSGAGDVAGQALVYGTYTATASSRYSNGGLQIRENGLVGSGQTDDAYAPAIGFHWGNRIGASLILTTSGFKFMNQAFTGYQTVYANFNGTLTGNATSATQVYSTLTNPTAGTWYSVPFHGSGSTSTNKSLLSNNGISYYSLEGTTSAQGEALIQIGNSVATGTAGNKRGRLRIYSSSSGWVDFTATASTTNYTLTLPAASGTVALTSSNVASASTAAKLTTARTIWGQSFNGTANVSGALSGASTIQASGIISTTAQTPGFLIKNGTDNKACFGWRSTNGAYLYEYGADKYLSVAPGGYPSFGGATSNQGTMIPHTKNLFSKADYEYYVVLLWETTTAATHRLTGKLYTSEGGSTRYQAADVNLWYCKWSTGSDSNFLFNTYGQNTPWNLVTCTYGGKTYYALQHTNIQAVAAYFIGTYSNIAFTAIKYYTMAHGDVAAVVNNSEINGSIADVTTSVLSANGSAYALVTSNVASATKLATARTLWGQSFNGTANISGSLTGVGHIQFTTNASYNIGTASVVANAVYSRNVISDTTLYLKSGSASSIILRVNGDTEAARFLQPNGYLGLGTTAPTERLHVAGNIKATGQITVGGNGVYANGTAAWFRNDTLNKGLYNSAGDARWYYNGTGWYADKAIISSSTIQGTQLKSTVATGTAPLTVASTTAVTNLNADMVDGIHAANLPLEYDASYTPTGTAARWLRIAYFDYTSASGSWSGTFAISNSYSNDTNKGFIFNVTTTHGSTAPVITQIGGDRGVFTTVRIVKDTTTAYPTLAKVYLEIYYNSTSAGNAIRVSYRPENRSINKWTLYTSYTAGSVPTGYTIISQLTTEIGMATTGNMRVQGSAVILGSTNHNNRLTIDNSGRVYPGSTSTRRAGMYGVYDAAKIGHIWSMGTSYMIPDDGANFGNLYGFAYKHTNNTTGGTMATGHQAVWCVNGTPKVSIGDNLWVANHISAGGNLAVTGTGSVKTLTIKNTEAIGHLNFSRDSYNYVTSPGNITFVVGGQTVGSTVADLTIQNGSLIPGTTNATSLGTSALRWSNTYTQLLNVAGAATLSSTLSVSSTLNVDGVLNANNTTDAGSTTSAGAVFDGGVGIVKQLRVGGAVTLSSSLIVPYTGSSWLTLATRTNIIYGNQNQSEASAHGLFRVKSFAGDAVVFGGIKNVIGFYGFYKSRIDAGTNGSDWATTWNSTTGDITHNKDLNVYGQINANNTTDSTSTTTGSIICDGGVGIAKQLRVGTTSTFTGKTTHNGGLGATTGAFSSTLSVTGVLTASTTVNIAGVLNANNTTDATSITAASLVCDGGVGVVKQLRVGGATTLSSTLAVTGVASFNNATDATSTTAAGTKVAGGLGVAKQLRIGGAATLSSTLAVSGIVTFSNATDVTDEGANGAVKLSGSLASQKRIYAKIGMWSDGYMSSKGLNDTSDMRLKNKVRDIFLSVKDIANAPAFEYTWKDGTPGVMAGSSAQYWQKVLSCSVREKKDGYLSMFYGHTAMVGLISLARHHESLEQRVARLEKENKEKDKTIEDLNQKYITLKNMYYGKIDSAC